MSILIESLGLAAGTLTTFSFLPQVIKIWRTQDVSAISLMMYAAFCFGVFLWLLFGIAIGSISLILTNGITFLFAASILYLKITIER
ncbi:MAG: SemiSWEET transporter [Alphaproteobacteria bacterium]|nr:SemiSWEET transporter [Alphaproteobacteria bacterium]